MRAGGSAAAAVVVVRAHPRHLLVGCLVAGLLAFGSPAVVLAVAALAAARGGRRTALGPVAAAVVLAGALLAQARVNALDRTALEPLLGHEVTLSATLLERPRRGAFGTRFALAALASDRGRGERVVLRLGREVRAAAAAPGGRVAVRGLLGRLGPHDDRLRRRGAHARLVVRRVWADGRRRGGLPGRLDDLRARAEASVARGLDAPRAALARGMVLGQDEALSEDARQAFRASGLAHLLTWCALGQNGSASSAELR